MKKITFILALAVSMAGFAQTKELKAESGNNDGTVSIPIHYQNSLVGCNYFHESLGGTTGGSGSSMDSDYKSAVDLVIPAGEDFVLSEIEVPFLTFAPEDEPTNATVVYYNDDAGFPGTEIGREVVVPTINSSQPWVNPIAYIFETSLDMTPFTFSGNASSDTTYWIEISMQTATNQATVFWVYTEGEGTEAEPLVQFDAAAGTWSIPDPTREGIYNFIGECNPLSVNSHILSQVSVYPNPTSGILNLKTPSSVEVTSVALYDILGKQVSADYSNDTINMSALSQGVYLLKVETSAGTLTQKIVKQ